MHRTLPMWLRVSLALIATLLLFWPLSGFYWCSHLLDEDTPSPDGKWRPTYVSAPATQLSLETLQRGEVIQDPASLMETTLSVLVAIALYAILTSVFGPRQAQQTICRRCRKVLYGLSVPQCPVCGEHI